MKPVILMRAALAAKAAAEYRRHHAAYIKRGDYDARRTADALYALGAAPSPDDVDRIIGHDSWTEVPPCSGCGARVPLVVQVGEEPDHVSATAYLCPACVREALAALGEGA